MITDITIYVGTYKYIVFPGMTDIKDYLFWFTRSKCCNLIG